LFPGHFFLFIGVFFRAIQQFDLMIVSVFSKLLDSKKQGVIQYSETKERVIAESLKSRQKSNGPRLNVGTPYATARSGL
jgi:hypothetical protein